MRGSVLLTENELRVNTIAFVAHDIVILLDPKDIVENIHDAYQHPAFRESKYAVLIPGLLARLISGENGSPSAGRNDFNCDYLAVS